MLCHRPATDCPEAQLFQQNDYLNHAARLFLETQLEEDSEKTAFMQDSYDHENMSAVVHVCWEHPDLLQPYERELQEIMEEVDAEHIPADTAPPPGRNRPGGQHPEPRAIAPATRTAGPTATSGYRRRATSPATSATCPSGPGPAPHWE